MTKKTITIIILSIIIATGIGIGIYFIVAGSSKDGPPEINGCTDNTASNYNPNATIDDGSCVGTDDARCPDGEVADDNGNCVKETASCAPGQVTITNSNSITCLDKMTESYTITSANVANNVLTLTTSDGDISIQGASVPLEGQSSVCNLDTFKYLFKDSTGTLSLCDTGSQNLDISNPPLTIQLSNDPQGAVASTQPSDSSIPTLNPPPSSSELKTEYPVYLSIQS